MTGDSERWAARTDRQEADTVCGHGLLPVGGPPSEEPAKNAAAQVAVVFNTVAHISAGVASLLHHCVFPVGSG